MAQHKRREAIGAAHEPAPTTAPAAFVRMNSRMRGFRCTRRGGSRAAPNGLPATKDGGRKHMALPRTARGGYCQIA